MESLALLLVQRPEEALELEARQRINDAVRAAPGVHFSELVRSLPYAPTTVRYHLTVLEREGVVSSLETGRYLRYYPREKGEHFRRDVLNPDEKRTLGILRQRVPLAVVLELLDKVETTHRPLTQAVGVSPSTLTHHLQKMAAAGVVVLQREGRETRIRLSDAALVRDLIQRFPPKADLVGSFIDLFEGL